MRAVIRKIKPPERLPVDTTVRENRSKTCYHMLRLVRTPPIHHLPCEDMTEVFADAKCDVSGKRSVKENHHGRSQNRRRGAQGR